jgi:hypothetical protein
MKKLFTTILLFLFFQNVFSQNCNLEFGYTRSGSSQRFTWDEYLNSCRGDSIILRADLISDANYQWYLNGNEIKGATQNNYVIKDVEGVYRIKVSKGNCSGSKAISIKYVDNINPSFSGLNILNDAIFCDKNYGSFFYISTVVSGNIKYQWQKEGVDIQGAQNSSYYISENGNYSARVMQGSCNSSTLPLEITSSNNLSANIRVFNDVYSKDTLKVCKGIPILLSLDHSTDSDLKLFKDNKLLNWKSGETLTESGVYHFEARKGDCNIKTKKLTLIFGDSMSPFTIEQSANNLALSHSPCIYNNLNIPSLTIFRMMSPSNEFTFEWKKNGITHSVYSGTPSLIINNPGNYSVVAKRGTCQMESEILEVKEIKPLMKKLSHDDLSNRIEICAGSTKTIYVIPYTFNDFQGGLYKDGKLLSSKPYTSTYFFNYSITEPGKYYTIYSNGSCTQYSDTLEITVKGRKTAPITLDKSQCQNGVFNLSVPNEDGLKYAWKKDGNLIPNLNTANITVKESGSYSAVINQDYCSVGSEEVIVGVKIQANPFSCEGQTLQLNSGKSNSYEWKGPSGFTSNLQNPSINKLSVVNQGMYFLKATDEKNCTFKDSIFIKTNPAPVFTVEVPRIICEGKILTITARTLNNSSVYYSFTSPDNEVINGNNISLVRDNATQQMAGVYKITATDPTTKCSTTATTQININSASDCPSITIGDLSSTKICYDSEIDIPFTTSGVFAPNTIFTVNNVDNQGRLIPLGSGTKSPIKIRISGYYRLVITSNDKNVITSPSIYVNPTYVYFPNINYTTLSACSGKSVSLKVENSPYYKYDKIQWKLNEKIIEGATSFDYSATESGTYSVDVSQNGCTLSPERRQNVKVNIGKLGKPYLYAKDYPYVCDGFSVDLVSSYYPNDAYLQWNLDGKPLDKMNASTLNASKKGFYSLTIKQGTCETTSDSLQVIIGDVLPNRIVGYGGYSSEYDPTSVEVCKGTTYSLFYQPYFDRGYFPDSIARSKGLELQWQKDGVDIPKSDSISFKVAIDGNYRLKIKQGTCVAYSKSVRIKFGNKVKLRLYGDSNFSSSSDYKNLAACEKDSIHLYFYGTNFDSYYNFPSKVLNSDKPIKELPKGNTSFYASVSGNYWVSQNYPIKGTNDFCVASSDTINIKIGGNKIEKVVPEVTSCLDSVILYTPNIVNSKYKWKFNNSYLTSDTTQTLKVNQTGTYQWEVNTPNCQIVSKPFNVNFGKLEATIEGPDSKQFCYGDVISLYSNIKSNAYFYDSNGELVSSPTFQWKKDGVNYSQKQYLNNIVDGTYTLTINQKNCSITTAPITVEFNKIPRLISPKDSTSICPNGGFMELESVSNPKYSYAWIRDNKTLANQTKSSLKASETGIYQAQIESEGCATLTYPVKVYQDNKPPTAFISNSGENIPNDSTRIKIDLTSSAPWTIQLTNSQSFIVNKTPFEFAVKPTQTTVYELASVKNTCGNGTVSGKVEAKVIILGNEEIEGAKISLFPVPTQNNCQLTIEMISPEKLEWYLFTNDGKLLSKDEKSGFEQVLSHKIDLEPFPNGKYLLKIIVGKKVVTREIVKLN